MQSLFSQNNSKTMKTKTTHAHILPTHGNFSPLKWHLSGKFSLWGKRPYQGFSHHSFLLFTVKQPPPWPSGNSGKDFLEGEPSSHPWSKCLSLYSPFLLASGRGQLSLWGLWPEAVPKMSTSSLSHEWFPPPCQCMALAPGGLSLVPSYPGFPGSSTHAPQPWACCSFQCYVNHSPPLLRESQNPSGKWGTTDFSPPCALPPYSQYIYTPSAECILRNSGSIFPCLSF